MFQFYTLSLKGSYYDICTTLYNSSCKGKVTEASGVSTLFSVKTECYQFLVFKDILLKVIPKKFKDISSVIFLKWYKSYNYSWISNFNVTYKLKLSLTF